MKPLTALQPAGSHSFSILSAPIHRLLTGHNRGRDDPATGAPGGGVMGLMTAYQAAPLAESVTVLDRSRVGDPATASFGLTRAVRNDYRDPEYARLAVDA